MLGQEDLDPNAASADPRSYNRKPVWARMCVISAGVIMNLIFGMLFFMIAFSMGVFFPAAQVGAVRDGLPAALTFAQGHDQDLEYLGLQAGDQILEINGETPQDFQPVMLATALGDPDTPVRFKVARYGYDQPLEYHINPQRERVSRLFSAGIEPPRSLIVGFIDESLPTGKRFFESGVRPDMKLLKIDNRPVESWSHVTALVNASGGKTLTLHFANPGQEDQAVLVTAQPQPLLAHTQTTPPNLLGLVPPLRILDVQEGKPAEDSGMQPGDILARVGSAIWPSDVKQIGAAIELADGDAVDIEVWRDGKLVTLQSVEAGRRNLLGMAIAPALDTNLTGQSDDLALVDTNTNDPLPPGSMITAVNGRNVLDWRDVQRHLMQTQDGRELAITFQLNLGDRPEETVRITLDQEKMDQLASAKWQLSFDSVGFAPMQTLVKADNPLHAAGIGLDKTREFIQQTYLTLARLLQGNIKIEHLSGPVGIVHRGSKVAEQGWPYIFWFMGLISVNLAVINFLPIPVVDGGHMVFLIAEKIRGKPVPASVQAGALYAGLALIAFVFLATLFYDVERLLFM